MMGPCTCEAEEPEEKAEAEGAYYHKTREERVGIRLHTTVGKESMHPSRLLFFVRRMVTR